MNRTRPPAHSTASAGAPLVTDSLSLAIVEKSGDSWWSSPSAKLSPSFSETGVQRGRRQIIGMPHLSTWNREERERAGVSSAGPSPEVAAMVADECRHPLGSLRDDTLRRVALLRMQGYTNQEVDDRLSCSARSVARESE